MMIVSLLGIIVSLITLIVLAYRGHSVIIVAPIAALVATAFSGAPLLATYTQIFMPALGKFLISFFPLFLTGAIFGKLMSVSGYAAALARLVSRILGPKQAIVATAVATGVLTYGGISAWVVAFTIAPIAHSLFKEAGISKRLLPAAIATGMLTFALAALPGSPQVHNVIPTRYFDTTTFAAPVLGSVAALLSFGLAIAWLTYRQRALTAQGEGYDDGDTTENWSHAVTATAVGDGFTEEHPHELQTQTQVVQDEKIVSRGLIAFLPVAVVIAMNFLFVYVFSKWMDFSYLAEEKFGGVELSSVIGVWSVTVGLATAIILIIVLNPRRIGEYIEGLSTGAKDAVLPVFTTASEVGYGAVIASLAVFAVLRDGLFGISDNALLVGIISTAMISGITGSASGGLSITLQSFGEQLAQAAADQSINLELMHRAIAMASVSFDSLPHNGAVITLLLVCGLTHRQSYKDVAAVTVVVPAIALVAMLALSAVLPVV